MAGSLWELYTHMPNSIYRLIILSLRRSSCPENSKYSLKRITGTKNDFMFKMLHRKYVSFVKTAKFILT